MSFKLFPRIWDNFKRMFKKLKVNKFPQAMQAERGSVAVTGGTAEISIDLTLSCLLH